MNLIKKYLNHLIRAEIQRLSFKRPEYTTHINQVRQDLKNQTEFNQKLFDLAASLILQPVADKDFIYHYACHCLTNPSESVRWRFVKAVLLE